MKSLPYRQVIAIAIAKARHRRHHATMDPRPPANLASEITMACLSTVFLAGLLFSTGALLCLAIVSIRCMIALW